MKKAEGQVGEGLRQVCGLEGLAGVQRPRVGGRRTLAEVHHERLHGHTVHELGMKSKARTTESQKSGSPEILAAGFMGGP